MRWDFIFLMYISSRSDHSKFLLTDIDSISTKFYLDYDKNMEHRATI